MMLNTQTEKACSKCGVVQPLDRFCKSSGANYLRTECRDCERELGRVRRELKRTHPTPGDDHICPICKKGAAAVKGDDVDDEFKIGEEDYRELEELAAL